MKLILFLNIGNVFVVKFKIGSEYLKYYSNHLITVLYLIFLVILLVNFLILLIIFSSKNTKENNYNLFDKIK